MQGSQTTFVIGAGASAEFGLPTGVGLITSMRGALDIKVEMGSQVRRGSEWIFETLRSNYGRDVSEYLRRARVIARGIAFSRSIDDFLYNHGEDDLVVFVGKMAIAQAILTAERSSILASVGERRGDGRLVKLPDSARKTWMGELLSHLQVGVRKSEVDKIFQGISFINFNYDRCLEHFFYHALQESYDIESSRAADIVSNMNIVHPYGRVGILPWEGKPGSSVSFGATHGHADLKLVAGGIRTLTEQQTDRDIERIVDQFVSDARRIVFLGFGFHQQNMEILNRRRRKNNVDIFGTVCGTSKSDQEIFRKLINIHLSNGSTGTISLADLKCFEFMTEYGLSFAKS